MQFNLSFGKRPIVNSLMPTNDAVAKEYSLDMSICTSCGLHQILHYIDPLEFYSDYMTPSSWKSEPHLIKLVDEISLIANPEDSIIDIGCNDGKFLSALRKRGFEKLHGIEPTKNTSNATKNSGFSVINKPFDAEVAELLVKKNGAFDVVVTRQVLEHIKDLKDFLNNSRTLLQNKGFLVIEVPDSEINFRHFDYGVWEEHINYFTKSTLIRILNEMGWDVKKWYRSVFSGWCQTVIAKPAPQPTEQEIQIGRASVSQEIIEFEKWASHFESFKTGVRENLSELIGEKGRIALFGVGARSISTLYSLNLMNRIVAAYDDNTEKSGRYIPGTKLCIMPFDSIDTDEIDLVLLGVNCENENKVLSKVESKKVMVRSILPPSSILLWK